MGAIEAIVTIGTSSVLMTQPWKPYVCGFRVWYSIITVNYCPSSAFRPYQTSYSFAKCSVYSAEFLCCMVRE